MVRLAPQDFALATARMCALSGVKKTRLGVKLRRRQGQIHLRACDGHTTLTAVVDRQSELPILEGIVKEYMQRCLVDAPAPVVVAAASSVESATPAAAGSNSNTNNSNNAGSTTTATSSAQKSQQQQKSNNNSSNKGGKKRR